MDKVYKTAGLPLLQRSIIFLAIMNGRGSFPFNMHSNIEIDLNKCKKFHSSSSHNFKG